MKTALKHYVPGASKFLAAMILAAGSIALSNANAAVTTFTDRASWQAAAGGFTETPTFPAIPQYSDVGSLTLNGGTTLNFDTLVNKRTIGSGWATWSGGFTGDVFYTNGATSVNAGISNVSGFGLDMEPNPFADYLMSLTLSDGSVITQSVNGFGGADFFGWVGSGVTSFNMSSSVDFAFGRFVEANNVPEPATTTLLGLGLLGFAAMRRKSSKTDHP